MREKRNPQTRTSSKLTRKCRILQGKYIHGKIPARLSTENRSIQPQNYLSPQNINALSPGRRSMTSSTRTPSRQEYRDRRLRTRGVKTMLIMTLSFYLCWIPFIVFGTLVDPPNAVIEVVVAWIPCLSTWVQPAVHLLTSEKARKIAKEILMQQI